MDEAKLYQKLHNIEALFAGATTQGEQVAAAEARSRILRRLEETAQKELPAEFRFSMPDRWNRRLFLALLRRYGLRPYRYPRQRRTTVMVRAPKRFVDQTLWPEFQELADVLDRYLAEVADRVILQVFEQEGQEAEESTDPPALEPSLTASKASPSPSALENIDTPSDAGTPEERSPSPRMPPARAAGKKAGRNAPCPCGSGKKYKRCCLQGL